jgi:hypothetical protein
MTRHGTGDNDNAVLSFPAEEAIIRRPKGKEESLLSKIINYLKRTPANKGF